MLIEPLSPQPPDRRTARLAGSLTYCTGRACPSGHRSMRYTSNGGCVACLRKSNALDASQIERLEQAPKACHNGHVYTTRQCAQCQRLWRRENPLPPAKKRELADKERARTAQIRAFVRLEREKPCTDCGECFPWYVTEFDHINGRGLTEKSVASAGSSFERVLKEMAKCELVCRNCHAVRTHSRAVLAGKRYDT